MMLRVISPILTVILLNGCGWVDSTGNQGESDLPAMINSSLAVLRDGESLELNENTVRTLVFDGADNLTSSWNWTRNDDQANINDCARYPNFEQVDAFNALSPACAISSDCEIEIREISSEDVTRFQITAPQLRAPVALEYVLRAQTTDGQTIERKQLICAVPFNDAPDAQTDSYTVTTGATLTIDGNSNDGLLANDTDDIDIRNEALQVIVDAESEPQHAANFQLFSDGGFNYEPSATAPLSIDGSISDEFTYSITDGTHTSSATVEIRVIDFNTAPIQIAEISDIPTTILAANSTFSRLGTLGNLNPFFEDAENNRLSFKAIDGTLPSSGNFIITEGGLVRGAPTAGDSGSYYVRFEVSDSVETIESGFFLRVARANGVNKAPFANDISNAEVSGDFTYDITEFFIDAEGDHMTFTATGLPANTVISSDGIISGSVNASNLGRVLVRVFANDGNGGESSDGFRLTLQ